MKPDAKWRIRLCAFDGDSGTGMVELGEVEVEFFGDHTVLARQLMEDNRLDHSRYLLGASVLRKGQMPTERQLERIIANSF